MYGSNQMHRHGIPIIFRCINFAPLRVVTLNANGLSWFEDEPIPSAEEPYDIDSVIETVMLESLNKPHAVFQDILFSIPKENLIELVNLARKKKSRFQTLCNVIK